MIHRVLKKIYEVIPGKKILFSLWKYLGAPPEKIFRHLYFKGSFQVEVDESHSFRIYNNGFQIENEMFWGGLYFRYEKTSLRLWAKLSEEAEVIMDVGANTGVYCLTAKAVNIKASVHAFEPVDRVFK